MSPRADGDDRVVVPVTRLEVGLLGRRELGIGHGHNVRNIAGVPVLDRPTSVQLKVVWVTGRTRRGVSPPTVAADRTALVVR